MRKSAGIKYFRELLREIAKAELENAKFVENELAKLPDGKLAVTRRKDNYYFTDYSGGRNRGITKNSDLVHALARKRYLESLKRESKMDLVLAGKVLKTLGVVSRCGARCDEDYLHRGAI